MTLKEAILRKLESDFRFYQWHVADISEAELVTRPCDNANHPAWQLGHIVLGEAFLLSAIGAPMPDISPEFRAAYETKNRTSNDPAAFLTKQQVFAQFEKVRANTVAFIQALPEEKLLDDTPPNFQQFAPKVVDLLFVLTSHLTMHIGQIQVARRKLGKPILF